MTKYIFYSIVLSFTILTTCLAQTPSTNAYKDGEYLKYRIHFGFINAGYATLELKDETIFGQPVLHAIGKGWTTGAAKLFYLVNDVYETYITPNTEVKPLFFRRRVDEDGYLIQRDLTFDHTTKKVKVEDLKKKTTKYYKVRNVQDMVSAFYFLRNIDLKDIKPGDHLKVNLFFDNKIFPFKLKFVKREIVSTKFGKIRAWKIKPMVQKGRVFKDQESLTIWISDDENKLPISIKASLAVGSLRADLYNYKGLNHKINLAD